MNDNSQDEKTPNGRMRTIVSIFATLLTIAILGLVFFTEFPWWAGVVAALVVIVPCQVYLNKTKAPRR